MFDVVWSNFWWSFKHDQTSSNTIKDHQTSWPNAKMFDHQTVFDDVWSSNISRLARALEIVMLLMMFQINYRQGWQDKQNIYLKRINIRRH